MIVDQEVDEFLAHYGVLGMKWGVRKAQRKEEVANAKTKAYNAKLKAELAKTNYERKTAPIKKQRRSKTAKKAKTVGVVVGGTALVVTGAYFANKMLNQHKNKKVRNLIAAKARDAEIDRLLARKVIMNRVLRP